MNDAMSGSYQVAAGMTVGLLAFAATLHAKTIQPGDDFPAVVLTCTLPGDDAAREWRVEQRDGRGTLVLMLRSTSGRVPSSTLPLPDAELLRAEGRVLLAAESANGGASVTIQVTPSGALLDVFVNHELEVNVHRDLTPAVEHMNTHGPRRDARCTVAAGGGR
jgi:hypothetical protein